MNNRIFFSIVLIITGITTGCKKKFDFEYDNRAQQQAGANSNTRLINLAGFRELEIDGRRLTSFMPPDREGGYGAGNMRITPYFPQTGQLSTTFSFPTEFIGSDGMIRNIRLGSMSQKDVVPQLEPLDLKDYGRSGMDYYVANYSTEQRNSYVAVPRDLTTSSNPANFKIRVLNLASDPDYFGKTGAMTLAWADGSTVADATTHVTLRDHSEYIELPYGTYQFKILSDDGREVPAKAPSSSEAPQPSINIVNPFTGTLMGIGEGDPGPAQFMDNWLSYAPIRTYQPGGVYTIVISYVTGYNQAEVGSNGMTVGIMTNCFQVINDIGEPLNNMYARAQAVNTLPGADIHWQIDQTDLGTTTYAAHTPYQPFFVGKHTVKAMTAAGTVVAEREIELLPGDNITLWAYSQDGTIAIALSTNNLSGAFNIPVNGNDGSSSMRKEMYPYWVRYMNFCPDVADLSFTGDNGQPLQLSSAASNLLYGVQKTEEPYGRQPYNFSTSILAYASKPGVVPGDWINNIVPLASDAFIKNIDLYKTEGKPNSEPGIYTVALVGRLNEPAPNQARIILIKHNQ